MTLTSVVTEHTHLPGLVIYSYVCWLACAAQQQPWSLEGFSHEFSPTVPTIVVAAVHQCCMLNPPSARVTTPLTNRQPCLPRQVVLGPLGSGCKAGFKCCLLSHECAYLQISREENTFPEGRGACLLNL